MLLVVLVIATLLFIGMLQRLQVGAEVRRAVTIAVDASAVVRSKSLTEEEKQKAVQKAAIASFGSFLSLLVRVALAASGATLVVALGMLAKLYSLDDVLGAASDWVSLLAVSVAALAAWLLWR